MPADALLVNYSLEQPHHVHYGVQRSMQCPLALAKTVARIGMSGDDSLLPMPMGMLKNRFAFWASSFHANIIASCVAVLSLHARSKDAFGIGMVTFSVQRCLLRGCVIMEICALLLAYLGDKWLDWLNASYMAGESMKGSLQSLNAHVQNIDVIDPSSVCEKGFLKPVRVEANKWMHGALDMSLMDAAGDGIVSAHQWCTSFGQDSAPGQTHQLWQDLILNNSLCKVIAVVGQPAKRHGS